MEFDVIEQAEGLPYRFAFNIDFESNLVNYGRWSVLDKGDKLWQMEIYSPGARNISFIYSNFNIPKGATFYIYNPMDTSKVRGGFTYRNNTKEGQPFNSGLMIGERLVLEYFEPSKVDFRGDISISKITHGYRNLLNNDKDFGDALPCQNNINCYEFSDWQTVMKSIAMIVVDSNTRICSGALINNYYEDERNFFLTAEHCTNVYPNTELWTFYFRYEQPDCDSLYDGTYDNFVNGGTIKASGEIIDGDFLLLELTPDGDTIPSEYDIAYSGWNALTTSASGSMAIHHPAGDVKKISFDSSAVIDLAPFKDYLWRTRYTPSLTGSGLIEGGSSGAPLFDLNQRIIGQHTTGTVPVNICTDPDSTMNADCGKFEMGYDYNTTDSTTYLKYWLDPLNTGITTLDLLYPNASYCDPPIRGNVDYSSDGLIDISDVVYMTVYMFGQGPNPPCEEEADIDASLEIDIADLVYLVDYMFNAGPAPLTCP